MCHVKNHLVYLPQTSMQVGKKSNNKYVYGFVKLRTGQKIVIPPFQQLMVSIRSEATYAPRNGAVEATAAFDKKYALPFLPTLVISTDEKTMLLVTNPHNHTYTLESCLAVVYFNVMTPHQAVNKKPVPNVQVLLMNNHS